MSDDTNEKPSPYVVALSEERAMYAQSRHRDRTSMVDAELAAHGWAVTPKGDLVKVAVQKNVPNEVAPPQPARLHKERAVTKAPGAEKAVDTE